MMILSGADARAQSDFFGDEGLFGSTSSCDSGCDDYCGSTAPARGKYYLSIFGEVGNNEDYDFVGPATFEGSFKNGWGVGASVGRRFGDSLRGELEYSYREVEGDEWIVNGNPGNWSGDFASGSLMANALLDLNSLSFAGIQPYVGAGLGFAVLDGDMTTAVGTLDIDETNFAWQAIAGASVPLGNHEFFAEYHFIDSGSVDILNGAGTSIGSEDVQAHFAFIGLRFYR